MALARMDKLVKKLMSNPENMFKVRDLLLMLELAEYYQGKFS